MLIRPQGGFRPSADRPTDHCFRAPNGSVISVKQIHALAGLSAVALIGTLSGRRAALWGAVEADRQRFALIHEHELHAALVDGRAG
jgi:hypothetical protein